MAIDPVTINDFHATLLHLLGIDHERLTYRSGGRDLRPKLELRELIGSVSIGHVGATPWRRLVLSEMNSRAPSTKIFSC